MQEEIYPKVVMPHCEPERVLKGQKALVTGANSGIGQAVAAGLQSGWPPIRPTMSMASA